MKFFVAIFILFYSFSGFSAVILKTKGKKALIDLEGAATQKGDQFDALNLYGKPKGVLEIRKIKKGKALGILTKGKMGVNWILEPRNTAPENTVSENKQTLVKNTASGQAAKKVLHLQESPTNFYSSPSPHKMGILIGPHINFVKLSARTSIYGVSWGGMGIFDFKFTDRLSTRLFASYQTLTIEGRKCENIIQCKLSIHYPGFGGLLKVHVFNYGKIHSWIGGGGSLLWPLADPRRDLNLHKASFKGFHGALTFALGTDVTLNDILFPIQLDFNWINPMVISFQSLPGNSKKFKPFYIGLKMGVSFSL